MLIYLVELPLAAVQSLRWGVVPLCFLANVVYFLMDHSSAEMEQVGLEWVSAPALR